MPTVPTQLRLTDADRKKIQELKEWHGLPSLAAAVRRAVGIVHREGPPKNSKKSRGRA